MDTFSNNNVSIFIPFVERLLTDLGISFSYIKDEDGIVKTTDSALHSYLNHGPDTLTDFRNFFHQIKGHTLYFITNIFQCNYVFFQLPDSPLLFCCGPVLWKTFSREQVQDILEKYDILAEYEEAFINYYQEVPVVTSQAFFESLFSQIMESLYGSDFETKYHSYQEIEALSFLTPDIYKQEEVPFSKIDLVARRYELENEVIQTVLSGKEILVLEIAERTLMQMPALPERVPSQLRNRKNYMLSLNTLLRKSIELKDVHPIYCDATSGEFAIQIEKSTNVSQLDELYKQILLTYCKIAKKTSHLDHSPFVDTVLTYIEADLRADLSLKTLASHLNVNASYLSALFSEEMGISLTNYVTKCRVEHAKQLLTQSNLSIKNIAFQCGFTDIHYFSRQFKKYTELSPKAYREQQRMLPDLKIVHHLKKKG